MKCFKKTSGQKPQNLPDMLSHLANYTICSACDDTLEKSREKYKKHSSYYKKIQSKYRKDLSNQYISRLMADNSILKPKDIPEDLLKAKRQYIQLKKLIKEDA